MSEIRCLHTEICRPSYSLFVRLDPYKRLRRRLPIGVHLPAGGPLPRSLLLLRVCRTLPCSEMHPSCVVNFEPSEKAPPMLPRTVLLVFIVAATAFAQMNPSQKDQYAGMSYGQGNLPTKNQNWQNMNSQQGQSPLLNGHVNRYGNTITSNVTMNPLTSAPKNQSNVRIDLQLLSYKGHPYLVSKDKACACVPNAGPCDQMEIPPRCKQGFMIVIASPQDPVQYISTHFIPLDSDGNLDTSGPDGASFSSPMTLYLKSKPTSIDVFVHNFGALLHANNNSLIRTNELFHVDTFMVPLDKSPNVGGTQGNSFDNNVRLSGTLANNDLRLTMSMSCQGDLIGLNCDLQCNVSSSGLAACINLQGYYSVCNIKNNQAINCANCPRGYGQDSNNYWCLDSEGQPAPHEGSGLVAASFETWTIILAILSGILLIVLIVTIVWACVAARRRPVQPDPGYNYRSGVRSHEGQAERPLLQTPNDANGIPTSRPPVAPMRMNPPSLTTQPQKSALRKGNFAPPAHYGGGDSVNETLNSSFASSVPMPPSRSADV
uniref:LAM_G_DOMAIN domain-containing protein n=1 Tax=Steinernema glaseri TaxID=37863 RepID=A0A1I8AVC8_9BILA